MTSDRIAIVGISGSGKSTFAGALAQRTGLPLLHGDQLEWTPGWRQRPPSDLQAMHREWIAQSRWIIEGWIDPDRAERLRRADLTIDLDLSPWRCAWRVMRRMLAAQRRSEMPDGCADRWRFETLLTVLLKRERRSIDAALRLAAPSRYLRFATPAAMRHWLDRQE